MTLLPPEEWTLENIEEVGVACPNCHGRALAIEVMEVRTYQIDANTPWQEIEGMGPRWLLQAACEACQITWYRRSLQLALLQEEEIERRIPGENDH